jgi:bifunctional ADP-heptose synthase (sugar kinase/adenylyltransferase)
MIATRYRDREVFAGGVIAAANHVAGFCREVEVITTLGADDPHTALVEAALRPNVVLHAVKVPERPTVCKRRYVENGYLRKLFEVYTIDERPIEGEAELAVEQLIAERAREADLVIATDFGHGMITRRLISALVAHARFLAVNTQSNSANLGYNLITRYPRADYVCIDAPEARLAMSDKFSPLSSLIEDQLSVRTQCDRLVVTEGKRGCTAFDRAEGLFHIPSFTRTVVDTVGAGDAFLAVTSPLVAAGGRMDLVGLIGNAAGAMKVGIVGHRSSIEKAPLVKYLTALLK